jgi:hypothetical protein
MESICSTSSVNLIGNLHSFSLTISAGSTYWQAFQGSGKFEKDYFNMESCASSRFLANTITNNIIKEEKEYYNKKVDDLFNLYEDRSNALNLYNIATENDNKKEIILAEIYLNKIEEKLNSVQEEALLLEKVIKMLN